MTTAILEPAFVLRYACEASSTVYCGSGLLAWLGALLRALPVGTPNQVLLCADTHVDALHGRRVGEALAEAGMKVQGVTMPAGEAHKDLQTVATIHAQFAKLGVERSDLVIVLGGGVPGDLFGFVATTYLRGLRLVQNATTLVAQVDSAIGGKVGVDLPEGKNMVGAFKTRRTGGCRRRSSPYSPRGGMGCRNGGSPQGGRHRGLRAVRSP